MKMDNKDYQLLKKWILSTKDIEILDVLQRQALNNNAFELQIIAEWRKRKIKENDNKGC